MQPDEVGTRTGLPLRKQVIREGGSTKEKEHAPMVMGSRPMVMGSRPMVIGSRPMAKERAAPMGGSFNYTHYSRWREVPMGEIFRV